MFRCARCAVVRPNAHASFAPRALPCANIAALRADGQVVAIAGGSAHSLAITRDGTVFQWGQSTFLQPSPVEFGYLKPQADEEAPSKEKDMAVRLHGVGIAAGDGVSAIVTQSGDLFTWGKNLNTGTLGHTIYGMGTRLPTRVDSLHGKHVRSVSIGVQHAAAVCDEPLA
ncbi:hypothetical protein EON67_09555 [archaeon]|nr:MAG: hypothetical protein EON67_09555 [archaeon]